MLKDGHLKAVHGTSIQVRHNDEFHSVCSASTENNEVFLFDSKIKNKVTRSLPRQLSEIYGKDTSVKAVTVQQQVGSIDCGEFAMAFAVEIAQNGLKAFEQREMRTQLQNCFQRKTLEPFPKVADNEESITSFELSKEIKK